MMKTIVLADGRVAIVRIHNQPLFQRVAAAASRQRVVDGAKAWAPSLCR